MDEKYFSKSLAACTGRYSLDNNLKLGPTPADFDNCLYDLVEKVWSHVIQLIEDDFSGAVNRFCFSETLRQIQVFNLTFL